MSRTSNAGQMVYNAVADLTNAGKRAHRETIKEVTNLRQTVVDNHLKTLKNEGRVRLVERGVYVAEPSPREERAVSTTMLPEGLVKLEIGDDILTLTMREARHVGFFLAGVAIQFATADGAIRVESARA